MKKLFIIFLAAISCYFVNAQSVGIGTNAPNASAQLDITSTTKGMLPPRMTTAQRIAIVAPANGLMVYDTNFASFYFYNGSAWAAVNSGDGGGSSWTANGNNIFNSNAGNVGIGSGVGLKEKLSIKGNLFVTHTNPNDLSGGNKASINLHGANTGSGIINFLKPDTTTGASIIYGNILSQFILQNGSNLNQLFLRSNGNVGVGSGSPLEKLDVNGNIRSRNNILADNDITLTGNLQAGNNVTAQGNVNGGSLSTGGNILVAGASLLSGDVTVNSDIIGKGNASITGTSTLTGNITTTGDIVVNNATGTLQLRNGSNVNKGFVQLSADNLRLGTNSGNTQSVIFRLNGNDRTTMYANGDINIEGKITNQATTGFYNLLPLCYGTVKNDVLVRGTNNVTVNFVSDGHSTGLFLSAYYTISCSGISNNSIILVTDNDKYDADRIAINGIYSTTASYFNPGVARVYRTLHILAAAEAYRVQGDFSFVIYNY